MKLEDVQNYINAKHELFLMAFPNAQACTERNSIGKLQRDS